MKKRLAIGGMLLWLLPQAASICGETIIVSKYLPLDDGNSWTYLITGPTGTYNETVTVLPGVRVMVIRSVVQVEGTSTT